MIRIQAFGSHGHMVLTPFSISLQPAGMPARKIEPDGHTDCAVRLIADPDRIAAGSSLSVSPKNTLRCARTLLTRGRKLYETGTGGERNQHRGAKMAHQFFTSGNLKPI